MLYSLVDAYWFLLKHWHLSTGRHGVTCLKTVLFVVRAMGTCDLTSCTMFANACICVTPIVKAYNHLDTERSKKREVTHRTCDSPLCFVFIDGSYL